MKKIYFHLSRFFDTTLVGILIGLITGVAINILTGEQPERFTATLICFSVACLVMIFLIRKRQHMDRELEMRSSVITTLDEKWASAIQIDNWKKRISYLALLLLFWASISLGTWSVIKERKREETGLETEYQKAKDSILVLKTENELLKKIRLLEKDSVGTAGIAIEKKQIEKESTTQKNQP